MDGRGTWKRNLNGGKLMEKMGGIDGADIADGADRRR